MQSGFFNYQSCIIHYRFGGTGTRPLVCFHGYGETAMAFDLLEKKIGSDYFILAIDLPFHGETKWNLPILNASLLGGMITELLGQRKIQQHDIHLLGFSLGGRLALCILQQLQSKVSRIVLLAPDGLTVNFWYWLSTQTRAGRSAFRLTMAKPGWFLGMLGTANKLRLINQSIYKFVKYYIHDDEVRKELYERWTGLRHCTPNLDKIKQTIQQHHIIVRLLYGRHDRIIGNEKGKKFLQGLSASSVEVLNCGHQVLHEKNAEAIARALLY
jgi:pimeloyl-ACP methyl ester carboxylesterase